MRWIVSNNATTQQIIVSVTINEQIQKLYNYCIAL